MLKNFTRITLCLIFVFTMFFYTSFAVEESALSVELDGEKLAFDVPPQIINNRTMVPMRIIFEALATTIEWDAETQTVTASKDNTEVIMRIDDATMLVDGIEFILDTPPCIIDGRTLVPVRAIAESLGTEVEWDANTQTVIITSKTATPSATPIQNPTPTPSVANTDTQNQNEAPAVSQEVSVSQGFDNIPETLINLLEINDGDMPDIHSENGMPFFITGKYSNTIVTDYDSAINSLHDIKALFNMQNPEEEFIGKRENELQNTRFFRLQQVYKGIEVYACEMIIATDLDGNIRNLSCDYILIAEDISITPTISHADAVAIIKEKHGATADDGELIIYGRDGIKPTLAWIFEANFINVIISADTGDVLQEYSLIH